MILLSREEQRSLLARAYMVATQSRDPSTQNGALIITTDDGRTLPHKISDGYNRFPDGVVETTERMLNRQLKYKYIGHAEWHAIEAARRARRTMDLHNCILVCPWACCTECAKDIISAKIPHVLIHKEALDRTPMNSVWYEDISIAHDMLRECGIGISVFRGKIFDEALGGIGVRHSGTLWVP